MKRNFTAWAVGVAAAAVLASPGAAQQLAGSGFFPDTPFPQYMNLWQEGWSFKDESGNKLIYARPDMPLGGYAFIYFRNTTSKALRVTDLTIEGVKLSEALGQNEQPKSPEDKFHTDLQFSKLPESELTKVRDAGSPVWWKAEPPEVAPGAWGEVVIRLRRSPKAPSMNVQVLFEKAELSANISPGQAQPRFATISFAPDLKSVYLYSRHPKGGVAPSKVLVDGVDMTASADIVTDPEVAVSPVVVRLSSPLKLMSYHNFRVTYADGSSASAGIRAWGREMVYGMWSSPNDSGDSEAAARKFVGDYVKHNVNAVMPYVVGACRDYLFSDAGWDFASKAGVDRMIHWPDKKHDALFLFAMDEPDANDANATQLAAKDRLGALGQYLVGWTHQLHKSGPNSPVLLNIDNTYKPENWYMYHQLPDIPCVDPYFPEQIDQAYNNNPYHLSAHTRPTYVQGVTTISQSSGQPKPLHVILCSTQYTSQNGFEGHAPTPVEKRMEVYYAIGSGAKGLSYWWMAQDTFCHGLATDAPWAKALWNEIGLLGAEVRTVGPIITSSCPVEARVSASPYLWVRTLLAGTGTIAVVTVNDNIAIDHAGAAVKPAANAEVALTLPSWLDAADAFEVSQDGVKDVSWKRDGKKVTLSLGTVSVSSFVLLTKDKGLRGALQKRYTSQFAANVAALKAEQK